MYEKIIILHTANYSRKIQDFFCVDTLINNGMDVEFWNCGKITVDEHLCSVQSEGLLVVDIESISDFENKIKSSIKTRCLFMSYISYAFYSYRLYRSLSKFQTDILYAASGCLPIQNRGSVSWNLINSLNKSCIRNYIRNRYYKGLLFSPLFVPLKFVMESCEFAQADYKVSNGTIHIACNSSDYECFQRVDPWVSEGGKPYSVFIDQYIPYHKDLQLFGEEAIAPSDYYDSLNHYFEVFERINACNVIIAAHPSALAYKKRNPYDGRQIVFNKTAELVKGAILVLAHYSTALSYAILGSKPIILLTSDLIENHHKDLSMRINSFKDMIGCDLQNVDHPSAYVGQPIKQALYDSYKYMLLTTRKTESVTNAAVIESIVSGACQRFVR